MAAHRYWRLNITADNGGGYVRLYEIQLLDSGNTDRVGSGTASASSVYSTYVASRAFDANTGTEWISNGVLSSISYDFGSGNSWDIKTFKFRPDSYQQPTGFDLQYSDDGSSWTTARSYANVVLVANAYNSFVTDALSTAAYGKWRVNVSAINTGAAVSIATLEFRSTAGGATLCVDGQSLADSVSSGMYSERAFDTDAATQWASVSVPGWLGYQFTAPQGSIVQVAITNRSGFATQAPKDFTIEYWDGASWVVAATVTGSTGWSTQETRLFTVTLSTYNAANFFPFI